MQKASRHCSKLLWLFVCISTCGFAQASPYGSPPPQQQGTGQQARPYAGPATAQFPGPGSLNYVQGEVSSNGESLTREAVGHFSLQPNQTLQTGNGYAEVLLTPGAFLRVGPNSELRMMAVGLADTRFVLTRGNALVEADEVIPGSHLEVTIDTTSVDVLKKGLYGFHANPPDVEVFEGKADVIGLNDHRDIGKNDQILLANNPTLKKTHFDVKQAKLDPLYVWSEARSRDEASQNKLVAQNAAGYVPAGEGWFWDPYVGYYGFWPPAFFYSPFGFGFYGGFYPGFYGGFYGGYHRGFWRGGAFRGGAVHFSGVHGNGVGGFHGGFHGGGFHGGGGRR